MNSNSSKRVVRCPTVNSENSDVLCTINDLNEVVLLHIVAPGEIQSGLKLRVNCALLNDIAHSQSARKKALITEFSSEAHLKILNILSAVNISPFVKVS